jgi:hypothetical protein
MQRGLRTLERPFRSGRQARLATRTVAQHDVTHDFTRPVGRPQTIPINGPDSCSPSVAVRGKPRVSPTVLASRIPSAICPWTPRHSAPQRYKVTHHGTQKNGPHSREFAASGPFSQAVAGVGFEPT